MGFRYCRYCEKIEGNLLLMHEYVNSKGKLIIDDIHKLCKLKEEKIPKKEIIIERKKEIYKKEFLGIICEICGILEKDKAKLGKSKNNNKIHLSCEKEAKEIANKISLQNKKLKEDVVEKQKITKPKKTIIDRILETPDRKICTVCETEKHISEFNQKRNMSYYGHCKKCHYAKTQKWVSKNKEKVSIYNKIYQKSYAIENKDKINNRNKAKYNNDEDYRLKIKEKSKKYKEKVKKRCN